MSSEPDDCFAAAREHLARVTADKEAFRRSQTELPWPQKVEIALRVRETCRIARESMRRRQQSGPSKE